MNLVRAFLQGITGRQNSGSIRSDATDASGSAPPDIIKDPPMQIDGRVMAADEFVRYVENLDFGPPLPTRIFLHHTWKPRKQDWRGHSTILAMKAYYERQLWKDSQGRWHEGWDAGPHLFVADDGIWLFSDLRFDGVGVYGHNYRSRHLEMVGDYDSELPSGPTLLNTIAALGILHERLGLDINRLNFHRDFSTKSCPGHAVQKGWIIPQVAGWIAEYRESKQSGSPPLRQTMEGMLKERLVPTNPSFALAKAAANRGMVGAISPEIPMEIEERAYVVQFFAEALVVPVHEWDKVQSLREFEQSQKGPVPRGMERARVAGEDRDVAAPPHDPYDYQGDF